MKSFAFAGLSSRRSLLFIVIAIISILPREQITAGEKTVDFVRDIKPILSDRCFHCHGPDEGQRQADLRLDDRDWAMEYVLVPGDPDASLLIERIATSDPDEIMPPPHANKPALTAAQVQMFRDWVEQGAAYAPHWSYVAPQPIDVPAVVESDWAINPIDYFVWQTLAEQQRKPSPDADPRTLVRRLAFDLTGMPPTLADVQRFVDSPTEATYQALVEKYLDSPAYGERMAVYWLDMVRYADTNGIHGDNHRDHDLYRDYVIDAFNSNMRFDRFTIEQLAGDLLPQPTDAQLIASGYNRLNMTTREGGAQPKEYITKYAADRVRNASAVWLGSTLGCAECHNHKYDPFTQRDFYQFAAFFADIQETPVGQQQPVKMPNADQRVQADQLREKIRGLRDEFDADSDALAAARVAWIMAAAESLANAPLVWRTLRPDEMTSSGGAELALQKDQSVLVGGSNPNKDNYTIKLTLEPGAYTGIRLEALTDPSLTNGSLSRANGNFVLTNVIVRHGDQPIVIASAEADFSQANHAVELAIDGNPATGWAVDGHNRTENRRAVFRFEQPLSVESPSEVVIELHHQSQFAKHNIGRFRLAITEVAEPALSDNRWPEDIVKALQTEPAERTPTQNAILDRRFRTETPLLADVREQLASTKQQLKTLEDSYRPILITARREPLMVRVLARGNWLDDSGEVVSPAVPSFLPQIGETDGRANRLDLARWLLDPDNPLVSRVFANRLWRIGFGEGLVRTMDDFGSQGNVPTHPELLDYLAMEFVESGWDIKHMLRMIVSSRAYRQSSRATAELREWDPSNQWLARQNQFRFDAEMVRDQALFVSGLLVDQVGGRSVKPYQPIGYWSHLNFPKRTYQHDSGDSQYRRGLYTYWCRTFLHPSLLAFDAPTREECTVQRNRSNTPLQALVLLNDPTYVEAARVFAEKVLSSDGESDSFKLQFAFKQLLHRDPSAAESKILLNLLAHHRKQYSEDTEAANAVLGVGLAPADSELDRVELASWTSVTRVLFNLHEVITRY